MPIRFNQGQNSRYQDEDDQLLGLFFGGLAQGAASYERAKDRRLEQDYRNKQYDLAKTSAENEQAYRQSMLTEAQEGRKAEADYKKGLLALEEKKTKDQLDTGALARQTGEFALDQAKAKAAEEEGRKKLLEESEGLASELRTRAMAMPLGFDYDRTFTDEQIMSIDPTNGKTYIDNRNKVLAEITAVAAKMNQADPVNRPGDRLMLSMQEANIRTDERVTEGLSKNAWSALANDTMFAPAAPGADGKPQQPSQLQQWYTTTQAKVATGAMSYRDAMTEMAQQRDQQIAYQGKLQKRSNLRDDMLLDMNNLRASMPHLSGPVKAMAQRQLSQMSGLVTELQYATDDQVGAIAAKYGGILGGQGQIEFSPEMQRFASERLTALEGNASPEAVRERSRIEGMLAQTQGFEEFGQAAASGQGTPFMGSGAAFTDFMLGGRPPAGPAVRTGDGAVVPGGGGTPETPPTPPAPVDPPAVAAAKKLVEDRKSVLDSAPNATNRRSYEDAKKELEIVTQRSSKASKVVADLTPLASEVGIPELSNISSKSDYDNGVGMLNEQIDAITSEINDIRTMAYGSDLSERRANRERSDRLKAKREKLKNTLYKVEELGAVYRFNED